MVRRHGLRIEQAQDESGAVRLRLVSDVLKVAVEAHGQDHAEAVHALSRQLDSFLAHPHPIVNRAVFFLKFNEERAKRATCDLGHPYAIVGRQRRCRICTAAYRSKYRAKKRAERRAGRS